ncbi:Putative oxidoreductase [hydrothermal vent metagenome]|uniref:Oxidoreductase n=1 Tax=hydrothermal vent metagenome TaxID=652676 RepID=A0A3B0SF09_9ZZZZ
MIDVIVIGGGPAGLSAAVALKQAGVSRVVVLEREETAGGIPRHCGHPPFGMREFKRIYTGPQYARRLVEWALAAGVEIQTLTTVVEAMPGAKLLVSSDQGISKMSARRIIYATGTRETPRSARLISGSRPLGVMNTGALQTMVYLKNCKPFERPVIVGTELVSFSAIATCRHMGIKPVAMIEENARITTRLPLGLSAPIMGVPLYKNTRLVAIQGGDRVSGVEVEYADGKRTIDCDGVVLTGKFIPEASLARCGHLKIDAATGAPVTDESGHCSDPTYFAVGNVLKPLKTAGKSWHEGRKTGWLVAEDLVGER